MDRTTSTPDSMHTAPIPKPKLWSPNAASNWSLIFTPVLGAILHAKNWTELGQPERIRANKKWAIGYSLFLLLAVLIPPVPILNRIIQLAGLVLLLSWYFSQGRTQARYVKEKFGQAYEKRKWGKPLLIGIGCLAGYIIFSIGINTVYGTFRGGIHDAARDGNLNKVKALLEGNADLVLSKDNNGLTPLHFASNNDRTEVAELLLAKHAEVNAKDTTEKGATPLHLAAVNGHKNMVALLLANKADVNVKDNRGYTPLDLAAANDHKDVVALLLANKADVNVKDNRGFTPLHGAAFEGYKDVVALLLANKADVNAKDNTGATPLHLAAVKGHKDVVELLREHGGHE